MEERRLLGVGEILDDGLEPVEDRVVARPQATDREVAAEHRPVDAEALDAMQDDLAQAFERRARIVGSFKNVLFCDVILN